MSHRAGRGTSRNELHRALLKVAQACPSQTLGRGLLKPSRKDSARSITGVNMVGSCTEVRTKAASSSTV